MPFHYNGNSFAFITLDRFEIGEWIRNACFFEPHSTKATTRRLGLLGDCEPYPKGHSHVALDGMQYGVLDVDKYDEKTCDTHPCMIMWLPGGSLLVVKLPQSILLKNGYQYCECTTVCCNQISS